MLPLPESAVLTGQIRLQSENYFNKSKLNMLLSILPLKAYFDSDLEFCRAVVAVNIPLFPFLPPFKHNGEKTSGSFSQQFPVPEDPESTF